MKFEGFLHLNIRCSPEDIPAIERFYGDVLGLKTGYRPDFKFAGIWLYDGDDPVIHVSARFPQGSIVKDQHNGSVDHIAFKASGAVEFRKHLKKLGIDFEEQNIENAATRCSSTIPSVPRSSSTSSVSTLPTPCLSGRRPMRTCDRAGVAQYKLVS